MLNVSAINADNLLSNNLGFLLSNNLGESKTWSAVTHNSSTMKTHDIQMKNETV